MATLFDFEFIAGFSPIFTFVIVFAITYTVLGLLKIGDKPLLEGKSGLAAVVAVALAFLFSVAPDMSRLVELMAPGFVLFILPSLLAIFDKWLIKKENRFQEADR